MNFILYMSIRGLGSTQKFLALKEIFLSCHSYIILLQETMHSAQQVILYFRKMFPNWHIAATDAADLSRGLVALWDSIWVDMMAYSCFVGILLARKTKGLLGRIHILNIYAPYRDKKFF